MARDRSFIYSGNYDPNPHNQQETAGYTITTTSGKQFTIDNKQADWIKSRYQNSMANSYGFDDDDQLAKRNGQLSAAALKTYGNTNVDRKLAELGLPSEKELGKYLEDYSRWHTGGMDQVFGQMNLPKDYWTKTKGFYQADMQKAYENTAEDQQRKARGLVPSKWEEKYTDTEIDEQLRARGLPPLSEFGTYAERWNNYQGIENFYANVARNETNLRLAGIKDDDKEYSYTDPDTGVVKSGVTGKQLYTDAFFDELKKVNDDGSFVYGSIRPLFKNSSSKEPTLTGDYVYDRGAAVLAENKNAVDPDDYASYNAFSYDDYKKKYPELYERYFANQKTHGGQLVSDALAVQQREEDAEATKEYYTIGKEPEAAETFAHQYAADYPDATPEQMFLDMEKNNVPDTDAYKVYETMKKEAAGTNKWYDIVNGWTKTYGGVWSIVNDSDAPIPDVAKPLTDEQHDAQVEKDLVKAAQQYGQALVTGDNDALYYASERVKTLGFNNQEDLVESLKAGKSDQFVQAVKDAITVYESAVAAYEDTAGPGAPSEASREPINKADEALRALGFKSIHDAIRYVGGEKEAMSPAKWVAQEGEKADSYVQSKKDADANDADTINDTANTIQSTVARLIDKNDELGKQLDVDTLLSVIDSISDKSSTNPTAMRLALTDLGFLGDELSGWAGDITEGWSDADKRKLNYYLGGNNFTSMTAGEGGANNDWSEAGSSTYSRQLKSEDFSLYLEYALQQVNAGNMTEADAYNLLAAKGYQEEMDAYMPEEWHKAHFIENTAPGLWDQSREEDRLLWEEMTPEEQRTASETLWNDLTPEQKSAMYEKGWWKFDPSVYRTFGQALEQQFQAVLPGLGAEIISTPVKVLDAIEAGISGRPEMWETTKDLMAFQQKMGNLGAVADNVNGAGVAQTAADVVQEIGRMYFYGSIGGAIGAGFAGTSAGAAVMAGSASNSTVVRGASKMFMSMVKSSPFVVSAFANNYSEAKALGASNSEATWFGLITGLSEGILEGFEFDELWGKALGQKNFAELLTAGKRTYLERLGIIGKSWVSSAAVSGLGEFTEESIGYVLDTFLKMRHSDTWGKGTEWSTEDWLQQAMMGFITGALGGGIAAGSSWVADGVKLTNAMKNNPQLQAALPDVLASVEIAESVPDSTMATYREGGATIMSKESYDGALTALKSCTDAAQNNINEYKKVVAAEDLKLENRLRELDGYAAKVQSIDTSTGKGAKELANLVSSKLGVKLDMGQPLAPQVKAAFKASVDSAVRAHDTAVSDIRASTETALQNSELELQSLQKKFQEHYVGLYLQNEGLLNSLSDEMLDNLAQAYQNGAKYEPSKETSADIEVKAEAQAEANDIVSQLKSNKQRLKSADVTTRAFTDSDEQSVKDAAKNIGYKGNVSFINDPNEKWSGKFNKDSGDIVLNRAYLTAYDVDGLQNNPAMWVLQHEMYHYVKEVGGEEFTKAAVNLIKGLPKFAKLDADVSEAAYNQMLDTIAEKWTGLGINADDDVQTKRAKAEEELVAKFAESYLFGSESSIKMLAQTNGGIVEKMLGWLRYRIDELKLRRSKAPYAKDILKLERMYAKALRDANAKFKPQKKSSASAVENSKSTEQASAKPASKESYSAANLDLEELLDDDEEAPVPQIANARTGVTKDQDDVYNKLAKKVLSGKATAIERRTLSNMVRDLAKSMGYDTLVYHGTSSFGFTKPDVKQSDDKISFFAADSPRLTRTYIPDEYLFDPTDMGVMDIRNRGEGSNKLLSDYRRGKIHDALVTVFSEAYKSNPNRSLGLFTDEVINQKANKLADSFISSAETILHGDQTFDLSAYLFRDAVYNKASEIAGDELSQPAIDAMNSIDQYFDLDALDEEELGVVSGIIKKQLESADPAVREAINAMADEDARILYGMDGMSEDELIARLADAISKDGLEAVADFISNPIYDDPERMLQYVDIVNKIEGVRDNIEKELMPYLEIRDPSMKNIKSGGTYKFYANTDNMYIVGDENNQQNWDKIWVPDDVANDMRSMGIRQTHYNEPNRFKTRAIAKWAKARGYNGVIYKNIYDSGGQSATYGGNYSTVYNFFSPETQLRSADDITLDDNKELIPYSERFDPESGRNDFRYSRANFDLDDLLNEYGAIEPGREPRARDVQVPRQTNDMNRVSQWIRSLIESGKLTDDQAQNVLQMVVEQDYGTYVPTSQAERMEEARAYIAERQPLQAQQEFHDMVMQGKFGVKTNALGIQLLSDASARGDIASVLDIAADLQLAATEAGQSAQIFNVLKELKGVGSAWYMQKVVDRMNTKYADRIAAGKMNRISVDPALMAELAKATTVDQMAAAEEAVAKDIARQLPLTWDDRLSSWRYFSMLANPTTHIRNITGNLLMKWLNTAKDVTAIGVQRVAEKLGLASESDRVHALLNQADKNMWGDWVQQSYEEQARNLSGGSKLGFESFVKQNMRSFDTKWVNALAQFNFRALENEDIAFIRPAYKNALMQYMVAQGYTLNEKGVAGKVDAKGKFVEMTKAQQNAAIDWASQQAWKQTFRDASDLATMLNKLSKENAVSRLLVEGVMPFKKTPINIARRGVDYSPAGIIKGIAQLTNGVKKGKVTTAQAIDTLSSGITGSALMALGVMLAKLGVIRAGGEKDKKLETFLEDTGDQTYAVKFGDKSINMSSIAPATIPLFMGVALNEMIEQGGDSLDLSTITDTIAGTLNPFMEMSFMSSLNSALKNYNANGIGGALGSTLMTAAQNYGSQYLPTLGGKIAQFIDPTRRTTKSDITSPVGSNMDYYARSLAKKVPGLESTLQPDVDVWGRTDKKDTFGEWAWDFANKFILPTNVKTTNRDAVDNELIRIVESTGVTDFLPSDGAKYFTVNKVKYEMNAKQYSQYSQDRGQAAYAALKDTMASASYKMASDEQKASMLKKALDAAYKQVSNQWKEKLGAYDSK